MLVYVMSASACSSGLASTSAPAVISSRSRSKDSCSRLHAEVTTVQAAASGVGLHKHLMPPLIMPGGAVGCYEWQLRATCVLLLKSIACFGSHHIAGDMGTVSGIYFSWMMTCDTLCVSWQRIADLTCSMSASALPVVVRHSWTVVPSASGPRSNCMKVAHASAASLSSGKTACSQAARRGVVLDTHPAEHYCLPSQTSSGRVQSLETARRSATVNSDVSWCQTHDQDAVRRLVRDADSRST